ncbi:rhodanese-like domain-containing protein [Solimonas sp. SE-A11]|uniref:rhodanese-like domain-containing protein n=1 Tax=Solimonas sp. SE-A11 TaxID=3054954 RepID=UPI00259CF4C0|nr:rhodanese-like domain-containing protein [Solimonas sp. SE-A11]MDM4768614.1 rhodanese-like domain-containing protein [Solimonas sp. SE-A11]
MDQLITFAQNHPWLFVALGVVVLLIVANEVHGNLAGGKRLTALEAVRFINDKDPLIIDLRTAADFKRGHLLNAVNAPFAKFDEYAGQFRDKSRPVLLYCALGTMGGAIAEKLRKQGYAEVYPLRGGINGWLMNSLPVTVK